jgi:hypothetical protein
MSPSLQLLGILFVRSIRFSNGSDSFGLTIAGVLAKSGGSEK